MSSFARSALLVLVCFLVGTPLASAQATRTWVSGVGDDANPCSRTAPCKTFAGAISKTEPGGEISVLAPGGFGAVTITTTSGTIGTYVSAAAAYIRFRYITFTTIAGAANAFRINAAADQTTRSKPCHSRT